MTVGDLKNLLSSLDEDLPVYVEITNVVCELLGVLDICDHPAGKDACTDCAGVTLQAREL